MIVPADAVVFDQNGLHVAVVENGVAHMQKIAIARDFGTEVEVQRRRQAGRSGHPQSDGESGRRQQGRGAQQDTDQLDRAKEIIAMRHRLLAAAAALLLGCHAGVAQVSTMGSTAMGLPSTPGRS